MKESDEHGPHWVLYALGGGMGHLTRTIAFARALKRDHFQRQAPVNITILTNSRFADILAVGDELGGEHRVITLHPDLTRDEVSDQINMLLPRLEPDFLVIDTFPRGIGGELSDSLPQMKCRRVLVHRDLNPRYVAQFEIEAFLRHYDQILIPGESAAFDSLSQAARTAPWLIRDADELLTPDLARRKLMIDDDDVPVVSVLRCGSADEVVTMSRLAKRIEKRMRDRAVVRFITPDKQSDAEEFDVSLDIWPFFESIRAVSLVVGAGGYNTVQETRAAGKQLIAFAWRRLYDRQSKRLTPAETIASLDEAEQRVEDSIQAAKFSTDAPSYQNGVYQAVLAVRS